MEHSTWLLRGFRIVIDDNGLADIELEGYLFTWYHGRGIEHVVKECLDRAIANLKWFNTFPNAHLSNFLASISYHNPILFTCDCVYTLFRGSFNF